MKPLFISLFILFLLAGCNHLKLHPSPASPERAQSSCKVVVADTIPAGIHIRVADKESDEGFPFSRVILMDSAESILSEACTDLDGYTPTLGFPEGPFNLKITYVGYYPLLIKNIIIEKGQGCRIYAHLIAMYEEGCWFPDYPDTDILSPQNRTITREEYRRMPK